jgi:AcrR family transcriptional regulator
MLTVMTRSVVRRRTRKPPEERRAEMLTTASALASAEGLESLTLRRVADELGVYPGLVSHYFQTVDELVVAAFRHAVTAESDDLYAAVAEEPTPVDRLRTLLEQLVSRERDGVSLLWLDAWSAFRHRPALAGEVTRLMAVDQQRLADLIRDGVTAGQFTAEDPLAAASRIYSVIDGLTVLAAVGADFDHAAVRELAFTNAERELELAAGALRPPSA